MPWPVDALPLARVEVHALAERQQGHVARVGAGDEHRLAQAPVAMAHHRDPLASRFVSVADRAVAHEAASHGVWQVGEIRLHVVRARGEKHTARPHFPRGTLSVLDAGHEAVLGLEQTCDRPADGLRPVPCEVLALPSKDFPSGDAVGKDRDIVAGRYPVGAGVPRIDQEEATFEAGEVERRRQSGRSSADDKAVDLLVHTSGPVPCHRPTCLEEWRRTGMNPARPSPVPWGASMLAAHPGHSARRRRRPATWGA